MRILYIIRGLPGSGKSHLARTLVGRGSMVESDMYFTVNGKYEWRKEKAEDARNWVLSWLSTEMSKGSSPLAVSSTSPKKEQYMKHVELAKLMGYHPVIIEAHGGFQNTHQVPKEELERMVREWVPHDPKDTIVIPQEDY